jgi:hypothetical protein
MFKCLIVLELVFLKFLIMKISGNGTTTPHACYDPDSKL